MTNRVSVPNGAWVIVADHNKALLLKNNGTPIAPKLEVKCVMEAEENPPTHNQGLDRPGTVFAGSHRSFVEQTDRHAVNGRRFLEQTTASMEKTLVEQEFKAIVLVAPPRALAELRDTLSDKLRASVVGELDKDLTHLPIADITRHLAA
jgi:protein required for attachment to host cells